MKEPGTIEEAISLQAEICLLMADAIKRQALSTTSATVEADFLSDPVIQGGLSKSADVKWVLSACRELKSSLPVLPVLAAPGHADLFRMPGHRRCFYFQPRELARNSGVIAIKGVEPLAPDMSCWLEQLSRTATTDASTQLQLSEHFAIVENKVPGALTLIEAQSEAYAALEMQHEHYRHFKRLAHIPVPLLLFRHSAESVTGFEQALLGELSPIAQRHIASHLATGLGVYVYYYPTLPLRVAHLDSMLASQSAERRIPLLQEFGYSPSCIVHQWIETFCRLLILGYAPVSIGSGSTGSCCDPNNAVVDGGFVDMDSVISLRSVHTDTLLDHTIHLSFSTLCQTVFRLLVGKKNPLPSSSPLVATRVNRQVRVWCLQCIEEQELISGLSLDPRVRDYFAPQQSLEAYVTRYSRPIT